MDELELLKQRVSELENIIKNDGEIPSSFLDRLQKEGFVRMVGEDIIYYINPSGREFYDTLIEANNEQRFMPFSQAGTYLKIDNVNTSTDTLTVNGNIWVMDNLRVTLASTDTPPGGLALQQIYYVVNTSGDNFQLSTTLGGSAINITSIGVGNQYITAV